MTNADVAHVFSTIANILNLQGENPFRIRAYERASIITSSLSRDLHDVYEEGGVKALEDIPSIGHDLALKIEEMLKTGKLRFLAELKRTVPDGLLEVMEIPGMGPKKTKFLWRAFRIKGIGDLEKLIVSGKLTKLKGWREKSVENIHRGIEIRRAGSLRTTLPVALAVAEQVVSALRKTGLVGKLEIAGSIRRRRETIGDIDILVTSRKPRLLMDAFCALPDVASVIAKGRTKSSVRLTSGLNADLRVVEADVFGAALYYFTGSKEHNVRLRTIARKRGITISEYGAFRGTAERKGKLIAAATEEDIFAALKLPSIPPELREDRGEIEAAQKATLPRLIELSDLRGDLHMHTQFSDGSSSMIEMARAAKEAGLQYIAITDHASEMGMVKGIKKGNIREYLGKIDEARKAVPGIRILAGAEVDILGDGRLYLPGDILRHLDWVVASVHSKFRLSRDKMTERLLRAIENPYVDLIGHPTTRILPRRPPVEFDVGRIFRAAREYGVALELNASVFRLDLPDILCMRAKEMGVGIAIGSDAHSPRELDYRFGVSQARRGWLEKGNVINTETWETFQKRLRKK